MVRVSAQREVAIDDGSRVSGKPEVCGGCRYGAQGAGRDSVCVWIEQPIGATCAHYRALIADDEDRVAGRAGRWDRSQRIQVLGLARAGCDGPKHAIKAEQGAVVADSPDAGVFCAPQRVERFFGAAVDWRPALAIVTQQCAAVTDRPLGLAGNRENVIELGGGSRCPSGRLAPAYAKACAAVANDPDLAFGICIDAAQGQRGRNRSAKRYFGPACAIVMKHGAAIPDGPDVGCRGSADGPQLDAAGNWTCRPCRSAPVRERALTTDHPEIRGALAPCRAQILATHALNTAPGVADQPTDRATVADKHR